MPEGFLRGHVIQDERDIIIREKPIELIVKYDHKTAGWGVRKPNYEQSNISKGKS
jgi:hypothetical protein